MAAKVKPEELRQALDHDRHAPVYIIDADGNTTHVVFPLEDARRMFDDYLRRELQIGFDQADRGESEPLDIDAIKAELTEEIDEQGRPR